MARAKSPSGGKAKSTNKEQTGVNHSVSTPDANPVAEAASPEIKASADTKAETKVAPASKKLEIRRAERKNVVPINIEDEIRRRAYELYQQRGSVAGSEAEDWLAAEREVMQRYHQHSA